MTMPTTETLLLDHDEENAVFTVTINREKKLNALNIEVLTELKTVFKYIEENYRALSVRGVILTGIGDKAFIAGADIKEMSAMTEEEAKGFGQLGQSLTLEIEALSIPVIACVNGFALGGGCELAMSCDFIFATANAIFGQPEVKLGLIPGFGGTQRLSKMVGRQLAKELVYTGRNMNCHEAFQRGLVNQMFPSWTEMMDFAKKTVSDIAKNSPLAVKVSKEVMNQGNDLTNQQGLELELNQFANIFSSEEMKEGTTAFLEKRAPNFK